MRARRTLKTHTLETRTRVFFSNSKHSKQHFSQTQNMAKNTFLKLKTLQKHDSQTQHIAKTYSELEIIRNTQN